MSWIYHVTNRPSSMTQAEMENNALEFYGQLNSLGWSLEAISATLGNIQWESYINPAQTQLYYPIGGDHGGYGLCMWTPQTKYRNWAQANNHDITEGYWQVVCLDNNEFTQYTPHASYPETFTEYKVSDKDLNYLTRCFFTNFEKGDPAQAHMEERIQFSNNWYSFLSGEDPPTPPTPPTPGYKSSGLKVWQMIRYHL